VTETSDIGLRLRAVLENLNLTQKALAQQLGIDATFLGQVMNGKRGVGHTILVNIAKAYENLNIRWLITGKGEMWDLPNFYAPAELESGQGVAEGMRIQYAKPEGRLEWMEKTLRDHERRLREGEGRTEQQ